jgi:hypothetical protein
MSANMLGYPVTENPDWGAIQPNQALALAARRLRSRPRNFPNSVADYVFHRI